jgi:hypothetical protein
MLHVQTFVMDKGQKQYRKSGNFGHGFILAYFFWGLKYIPRLFSEYMLTFRTEEPMKICVTN